MRVLSAVVCALLLTAARSSSAGAKPTTQPVSPQVQMIEAVKANDASRVAALLKTDAKLADAKGPYDKSALHWAAERNSPEVAELLLEAGAVVDPPTSWGMTPLEWAANGGHSEVGEVLRRRGAKLTLWSAAGLGLLREADAFFAPDGSLKGEQLICKLRTGDGKYARTSQRSDDKEAISEALYIACRNGHTRIAGELLKRGADVDHRGWMGGTPLHWAAGYGHADTVDLLLRHGADVQATDEEGKKTPLAWALEWKQAEVAQKLRQAGAKE
jgi:ankyrin repeat protein